jgi:hypothetical protein
MSGVAASTDVSGTPESGVTGGGLSLQLTTTPRTTLIAKAAVASKTRK